MRLTYAQFKQKIAETKAKIAKAFAPKDLKPGERKKLSETQKKRWHRARKTAPRAACDSFRYRSKHLSSSAIRRARRVRSAIRAYNASRKANRV